MTYPLQRLFTSDRSGRVRAGSHGLLVACFGTWFGVLTGCGDTSEPVASVPDADATAPGSEGEGPELDAREDAGNEDATDSGGPREGSDARGEDAEGTEPPDARTGQGDGGAADVADDGREDGGNDATDVAPSDDTVDADATPPPTWPAPRPGCNGHEALCERAYDEVVFPGTHNAMSNQEDGWILPNQNRNLRAQLVDGVRVLLLDVHPFRDDVWLCHSICRAGRRLFVEALRELDSFLEANPGEVVTLLLEDYVDASVLEASFAEAGLVDRMWTFDGDWPTLGEMVEADRRLVVGAQSAGPPPAWLHNLWEIGWDSPYSFDSVEAFSCAWNRGRSQEGLFLLNHWVLDPVARPETAVRVNSREVLQARVAECEARWGRLPNFVAVDFYDTGDLFAVVDALNGVGEAGDGEGSLD